MRTPTRFDQDLTIPNPRFAPALVDTTRDFESEELIAYEVGYRIKPSRNLTIDLAVFYHVYDNLRSLEPVGPDPLPITLGNMLEGESYGAELSVEWHPAIWWKLEAGYTIMQTDLHASSGSRDTTNGSSEGNDPNHILVARSSMDLPGHLEFDVILRYVDRLPLPATPAYMTLDVRLGWHATDDLELALVGRNLLDEQHPEFRGSSVTREIGRSIFGTVTWRF